MSELNITPEESPAEAATAWLAPGLVSLMTRVTESQRGGFAAIILLLAIGLFTRPAAALLAIQFVFVTYFHSARGFFSPGLEFPLLWLTVFVFFAVRGGGVMSVDSKMGKEF